MLLPLFPRYVEAPEPALSLDTIAADINGQLFHHRPLATAPGLDIESLPIIGELIDEAGNFDWGMSLPISIDLGNVMGQTGLIFSADFATD